MLKVTVWYLISENAMQFMKNASSKKKGEMVLVFTMSVITTCSSKCSILGHKNMCAPLYLYLSTIQINSRHQRLVHSQRTFNSPFREGSIMWPRLLGETYDPVERHTPPKLKVTKMSVVNAYLHCCELFYWLWGFCSGFRTPGSRELFEGSK